jgi:bifunctional non-homologous end joining protein LigD
MLAASGRIAGHVEDYAFEPKWDGWRALVTIHAGQLVVRTRRGHDVTAAVPELASLPEALPGRSVVLDGELVAGAGTPGSFYRISGRMAARRRDAVERQRSRTQLTFVPFDLLWLDGDMTGAHFQERRAALESLGLRGTGWCTSPSWPGLGPELFAACTKLGLEGLVAKRLDGRYYPGERRSVWVKAKCAAWYAEHAEFRHRR